MAGNSDCRAGGSGPGLSLTLQGEGAWAPGCNEDTWFPRAVWGPFSVQAWSPGPCVRLNVCPPLQVLHQVLAVAGLPRVPEEHDVRSEVQALQVWGGCGRGGARGGGRPQTCALGCWP